VSSRAGPGRAASRVAHLRPWRLAVLHQPRRHRAGAHPRHGVPRRRRRARTAAATGPAPRAGL